MRSVAVAILLALITTAAAADTGPWSAPNWYVSVSQKTGPFVHTTGMAVTSNQATGKDDVEVMCQITDTRRPQDAIVVRRKGTAQMAQGLWCGGASDLGTWCLSLETGARIEWFEKTPCAKGVAEFSTGD
ncbi:hypothetical protein [Methylobacterium sp. Leaf117]|uniref:hypothetical protein n=1 Tax=Methylobacterium sp. Leaf117 TaxID=1736260 RepID=UPI0006F490B7|nr:hypothetical protein [Methylobacterium sp. Leaf117]KQP90778.1 hypothetical protein ASF57_23515 [Methylobacterium sp. Leaf117]